MVDVSSVPLAVACAHIDTWRISQRACGVEQMTLLQAHDQRIRHAAQQVDVVGCHNHCCSQPVHALEQLQQALQELTQVNRQLEEMSTVDSLTDTKNHSYFLDRLQEEWVRGSREKSSMSLVLVSIDQFQHLADRYGYVAADEVVKLVAGKLIRRVTRPADLVARIDNSEFAVLLPNTDAHGGLFIAEDIYRHIVKEPLNLGVCSLSVSVSIAVCAREPSADSQGTLLLESTQYLLWTVIESGGNRVVLENDIESIGQT